MQLANHLISYRIGLGGKRIEAFVSREHNDQDDPKRGSKKIATNNYSADLKKTPFGA
jgi:hypothetical protein